MPTNSAHEWRHNALFRLLAFLDNTKLQSFDLATEVKRNSTNGEFVRPNLIFAESTPIYNILTCGLRALRANVMHLFTDDVERYAILSIIGTEGVERKEERHQLEHQQLEPTEHIDKNENNYYDDKRKIKIIASDVKNESAEDDEHVESCTRYDHNNNVKREVVDDKCTSMSSSSTKEQSSNKLNNIVNNNDNRINVNCEEIMPEQEEVQLPTIKRVKLENEEIRSINKKELQHHEETSPNWNSLPLTTAWCKSVCTPSSFTSLIDTLENSFPLHLLLRLQSVLGIRSSPCTHIEQTETEVSSSIAKKNDSDIKCEQVAESTTANTELNKQAKQTINSDKSISQYSSSYCTSSAFVEQFLIDALDYWLTVQRTVAENEALILACEVQPSVLESIKKNYYEQNTNNNIDNYKELSGLNEMFEDFLIDVIFPLSSSSSSQSIKLPSSTNNNENRNSFNEDDEDDDAFNLNDWLIMCYEKNHEMTNVDDFDSDTSSNNSSTSSSSSSSSDSEVVCYNQEEKQISNNSMKNDQNFYKRKRNVNNKDDESNKKHKHKNVEYNSQSDDTSSNDRDADSDEIILSAENIDEYMQSSPDSIPDYIKREKRRSWLNPTITKFELEHHYTLQELRRMVKHIASSTDNTLDLNVLSKLTSTKMQWCRNATDDKEIDTSVNKEPSNKSINSSPQSSTQTLHIDDSITDAARHARKKAEFINVILQMHANNKH